MENTENQGKRRNGSVEGLQGAYRSAALMKKHSLVVGFRKEMEKGSRWKKTETVFKLLEKLAADDGIYQDEMQQVVRQLYFDLFHPLSALPHPIQHAVESEHIEAFLSSSVPLHILTDILLSRIDHLEKEIAHTSKSHSNDLSALNHQLASKDCLIKSLELQVKSLEAGPAPAIDPLELLKSEMAKAASQHLQLQQQLLLSKHREEALRDEISLKADMLKASSEECSKLRSSNQELQKLQQFHEAKISKLRTKSRTMKFHLSEAVSKWKLAASKQTSLENQLKASENEAIALKERAAAGFDELTPRPDWPKAGIALVSSESNRRKSSQECLLELMKKIENNKRMKKAATTLKHKGKKLAIPGAEKAIFSTSGNSPGSQAEGQPSLNGTSQFP